MRKNRGKKKKWNRLRRWARLKKWSAFFCPICRLFYNKTDRKRVQYHISYEPSRWIFACQSCNEVEYRLRNHFYLTSSQEEIAHKIRSMGLTYKPKGRGRNRVRKAYKNHNQSRGYWVTFQTPFGELRKWRSPSGKLKTLVDYEVK